jgi:hypothetical protein
MTEEKKAPRVRRPRKGVAPPDPVIQPAPLPSSGAAATTAPEEDHTLEHALEALSVDHATAERLQKLPHDIGWLLVTAGVVGVVMPGVLGVPFLLLGGLILTPVTNRHAERWLSGHGPKVMKGSMRQINRFLDDLERRYPHPRNRQRT